MLQRIYLDNAATTRLSPEVKATMEPFMDNLYGNPSSLYQEGVVARMAVESSRKSIAMSLGCHPSELLFTSCGTESNNMALRSAVRDQRITQVITSRLEHPAVLNTLRNMAQSGRLSQLSYVAIDRFGNTDLADLSKLLRENHHRTLVTLMHANNETGTLLDIGAVGALCKKYGALFHSDCVQTVGHLPINLSSFHVDMISASAHKFHGPKGSGLLYVRKGINLKPIITGGSQERSLRAGTENVAGIVGFAKALEQSLSEYDTVMPMIRNLKAQLYEAVSGFQCSVNGGDPDSTLYTILNVGFPKTSNTDNLLMELDMAGISVSGGSACSAGKGSYVMQELGATDTTNVRFSFSKYNSSAEIDKVIKELKKIQLSFFLMAT